jgi:shikimate kinase/3-dehydroquinate synthase
MTLRCIALVGLPGSGKSTVGRVLGRRLGWDFVDIDSEVAAAAGKPVATLIADEGEVAFRELELSALERTLRRPQPAVIACGGGLVAQEESRRLLIDMTCVVWLDAPDQVLLRRLGDGGKRPLLRGNPAERLPQLRTMRQSAYEAAHMHIAADGSVGAIVDRISRALEDALRVSIPGHAYHVEIRPGAISDVPLHVPAGACRVALIADSSVPAAEEVVVAALRSARREVTTMRLSGGEAVKTWSSAGRLLTRLSSAGLRRHDCVIALGGGTIGDLAGFVAATHLRGVAWINVPTTLLAMVDSAIGGKTGVNLARGKNLAGAIWQPRAVVCDPSLLATLPERAYRSAFAEIIKYAMVRGDGVGPMLDHHLARLLNREPDVVAEAVRGCCAIKAEVVAADERDADLRAILNYGHTIGHALEAATHGAVNHGEAVAVGMRAAGALSIRQLGCPDADIRWQDTMLERCGLGAVGPVDPSRILKYIAADKKVVGEQVRWVLLEERGKPRFGQIVPEPVVRATLQGLH